MVGVRIDVDKCSGCGTCVDVCPEKVFELQEEQGKKVSKVAAENQCFACRACELRCPERAIEIIGFEIHKVNPPPDYPPEEGRYLITYHMFIGIPVELLDQIMEGLEGLSKKAIPAARAKQVYHVYTKSTK